MYVLSYVNGHALRINTKIPYTIVELGERKFASFDEGTLIDMEMVRIIRNVGTTTRINMGLTEEPDDEEQ